MEFTTCDFFTLNAHFITSVSQQNNLLFLNLHSNKKYFYYLFIFMVDSKNKNITAIRAQSEGESCSIYPL